MAKTPDDVIQSFMNSLDTTSKSGTAAVDEAVRACSNFSSAQAAINQMVEDCQNASSATDFLQNKCGIILNNTDTGAITGSDAGGSKTKTAESVVPESGSLKSFTGSSFTTNGVTFQLADMDTWQPISYSSLDSNERFIWRALYTWWAKNSFDLIASSYGKNFGFDSYSSSTVDTIYFGFFNQASGTGAYTAWGSYDGLKTASSMAMAVNTWNFANLDSSKDPNGQTTSYLYSDYYLDRCLAHEFTHAVMAANIDYCANLPQFLKEGMAELTHGADDVRTYDIEKLAGSYTSLSNALNLSDTGTGTTDCYAAGYMFLRYLAKQGATPDNPVPVPSDGATIYNTRNNTVISGTAGADIVYSGGNKVKINTYAGNDYVELYTNSKNNTVKGGVGNDALYSGGTSVKLYGESGNDYIYLFSETANVTVNGGNDKDSIHAGGKNIKIYGGYGNDYAQAYANAVNTTIKGDAGSDVLESGGNKVKIYGDIGNDSIYLYANAKNNTIYGGVGKDSIESGGVNVKINGDAGNDYVYIFTNASKTTVNGGADKDEIYNGGAKTSISGGAGNDYVHLFTQASNTTINGGKGNDTIKSYSENKVTYLYKNGDGKDVIDGFDFGTDKIKITSGSIKKTTYKGNDVIFKIGSGSITVKNGRGQNITLTNAKGKTTTKKYGKAIASSSGNELETYYSTKAAAHTSSATAASKIGSTSSASSATSAVSTSNLSNSGVADTWFTEDTNLTSNEASLTPVINYAISVPSTDLDFDSQNRSQLEQQKNQLLTYAK